MNWRKQQENHQDIQSLGWDLILDLGPPDYEAGVLTNHNVWTKSCKKFWIYVHMINFLQPAQSSGSFNISLDCAMAQVVSCRPLTTEAQVRARVSPCVICGGQTGTGTGFSPSSSVFPCQHHSTMALHSHVSYGGWTIGQLQAAVQRHSLTPLTRTTTLT
jgi:hypothetical protein